MNSMTSPTNGPAIVKPLDESPESWWICPDAEFPERYRFELPRILGSAMAKTIRPIILGGKLP
jgi:hypothetical protein